MVSRLQSTIANRQSTIIPVLLSSLLLLAGCGGGGMQATQATGGGQDRVFGPFQTRAASGHPQSLVQSAGNATITGIAGASFLRITYLPPNNPANSRLLFVRTSQYNTQVYIANNDGSNPRPVPGVYGFQASWSRDGRIVFDMLDPATGIYQIYVANSDGTNLHKISTGGFNDTNPVWAPDNFHIAFQRVDASTHQQVYSMTSGGASVTRLSDGTAPANIPVWSPDATRVFYRQFNSGTNSYDLWTVNANGTSPSVQTGGIDVLGIALSPSGARLAISVYSGGLSGDAIIQQYAWPSLSLYGNTAADSGISYYVDGWSADGTKLVYQKVISGSNMLIASRTSEGGNETPLASFGDGTPQSAQWEPYPVAIPYVASTGGYTVNNASSGFLYGMNGASFASFVNFTATTPASTSLTVDPITVGSSTVIYHIHADALTSIKYLNGFGGGVNIASLGAGAQQALVAFSASDGTVASVLTVASKSAPTLQHSNTSTLYKGSFSGVFNAKGVNLAPSGASAVTVDRKGEVVTVR